jgi:magnesium transporter
MEASAHSARGTILREFFYRYPGEAARLLERWTPEEIARLLAAAPAPHGARTLERLDPEIGARVLCALDGNALRRLLPRVDPRRAAAFLVRLEESEREERLALAPQAVANELREQLAYPPDSAGSLMDPRVRVYGSETTCKEVVRRLRPARDREAATFFVVDDEGRLTGVVTPWDLLLANPSDRLVSLAHRVPATVVAHAEREEVVRALEQHGVAELPVVDLEGRLLGAIRYDVLLEAAQEEVTADLQTMVGAGKEERALSKVSYAVRKRLPWLEINLLTAFVASAVVGLFEGTIARFTALAVLLPVVAGQSGNTGAQALAVTMRGLTLREIGTRQWLQVISKETWVGVVNGIAIAATTAAGVYVWSRSFGLALVIGLSMVLSMVAAGLAGAAIPIVLKTLGQDPAQSSSIVLTTVTDVVGFFSFLGIATALSDML